MLGVTGLAAHPQKPVLETAAFEVILELASDIRRQLPALLHQMGSEYRVILIDDPIEKHLLGTVATPVRHRSASQSLELGAFFFVRVVREPLNNSLQKMP
jgi:hypothetical protein